MQKGVTIKEDSGLEGILVGWLDDVDDQTDHVELIERRSESTLVDGLERRHRPVKVADLGGTVFDLVPARLFQRSQLQFAEAQTLGHHVIQSVSAALFDQTE